MDNNQNNPQEVPQVKSVEELAGDYYQWKKENHGNPQYIDHRSTIKDFSKGYEAAQSRIAELEKQNAVYREALEGVVSTSCKVTSFGSSVAYREAYQIAEQALNYKDNG